MRKGIFWIASYPKSGNTWFRAFLANYLRDLDVPVDINELDIRIASRRSTFDSTTGLESVLLTHDEAEALRPACYERFAAEAENDIYLKIHDACYEVAPGCPLVSIRGTRGAIHIVRNPLDVAVSLSHFWNMSIDACIAAMEKSNYALCNWTGKPDDQFRQKLFAWGAHVQSWADTLWFPVLTLRYEDMKADPAASFGAALDFLGLARDEKRIAKALRFSSFEELKRQEEGSGFRENNPRSRGRFFRDGRAGGWKDTLSAEQVRRLVSCHGFVMRRFGYLDEIPSELCKGHES